MDLQREMHMGDIGAAVQLYATPLGLHMVIGLPDIRVHFAALLMDMILDGY